MNKSTVTKTTAYVPIKVSDDISLTIETRENNGKKSLSGKITKSTEDGSTNMGFIDINPDRDTMMINVREFSSFSNDTFKSLLSEAADAIVTALADDEETSNNAETTEEG